MCTPSVHCVHIYFMGVYFMWRFSRQNFYDRIVLSQKLFKLSLQLFTHIVLKINADLNYKNYFMIFLNPKKTRRSGKGKPAFFYIRG